MSQTNETTNKILNFLFSNQIFAWRQNTTGIPLKTGGFRPTSKKGVPDIIAILAYSCPSDTLFRKIWHKIFGTDTVGRFIGIEIKTGRDKLSPEQIGFQQNCLHAGGIYLAVGSFEDFMAQWEVINDRRKKL